MSKSKYEFRLLRADEIDVRVAMVNEKGVSLLLYKDARVDQNVLDETFGIFGWQRHHQMIGDNLYCTVSVYDAEKNQWIEKQDVGTESNTEKEKGQASDSFKRACFNLGIGRELYSAPFIWLDRSKVDAKERGGKWYTNDRFTVASIGYDENRRINQLTIENEKTGKQVYYLSGGKPAPKNEEQKKEPDPEPATQTDLQQFAEDSHTKISDKQAAALRVALAKYGKEEKDVCYCYSVSKLEDMTVRQYKDFSTKWDEFKKRKDDSVA